MQKGKVNIDLYFWMNRGFSDCINFEKVIENLIIDRTVYSRNENIDGKNLGSLEQDINLLMLNGIMSVIMSKVKDEENYKTNNSEIYKSGDLSNNVKSTQFQTVDISTDKINQEYFIDSDNNASDRVNLIDQTYSNYIIQDDDSLELGNNQLDPSILLEDDESFEFSVVDVPSFPTELISHDEYMKQANELKMIIPLDLLRNSKSNKSIVFYHVDLYERSYKELVIDTNQKGPTVFKKTLIDVMSDHLKKSDNLVMMSGGKRDVISIRNDSLGLIYAFDSQKIVPISDCLDQIKMVT